MSRIPLFVAVVLASLITGCASLPSLEGRTASYAFADTAGTRLGRPVATGVAANPGKTGIHALPASHDVFAARSSSSGAMHAKTFAVDGNRIFAGSFNFDPRSAWLNTEMGLVIQSTVLTQRLPAFFDYIEVPMAAYEVRLTPDGSGMEWIEQTASGVKRYDTDPGTSWFLRRQVDFLSILPIEWLL